MALDAQDLARRAAELGGEEAVASVSVRRELAVRCGPSGALAPPRRTFDIFVRLLVRDGAGRLGVARCSASTSTDQLRFLAEQAHRSAAASQIDLRPMPDVVPGPVHLGFDPPTAALDPGRGAGEARQAAAAAHMRVGLNRAASWVAEDVEVAVARSGGGLAGDRRTGVQLTTEVTDGDGRLVGYAQASGTAAADIDAAAVGAAATPLALPFDRSGGPVLIDGREPVVLLPAALAPLLEALTRAACTGHAHAIGTSPFTGRLGTIVAPVDVTLVDDPGRADGLPRAIDVEGVPATTVSLFEAGVAGWVLHDSASAAEAGERSTGHAAELGGTPAGPLPRNLVLSPGIVAGIDGLLAPVERSVVIGAVQRVITDGPGSTRFSALGRAAYAVERGTPSRLLGDVLITGDLVDVLAQTEALGVRGELVAAIDRLPERTVATRCPPIRASGISVMVL